MTARRGAGTEVALGSTNDPLTATFTVISQVKSVRIQESGGEIEVTDLASTRKQYIQALPDAATISMTIHYDPAVATHNETTGLVSLYESGAERTLRILPTGATKYEIYRGFVMDNNRQFEPSAPQELELTFRATGAKTVVAV